MAKRLIKNIYYTAIKSGIFLRNLMFKHKQSKYVFILSPPYSGSTLLNEVLSTSNNVSSNNNLGSREGQTLPGVSRYMYDDVSSRWDKNKKIPWKTIKQQWSKYWDKTKTLLLEKSPPNIVRASVIEKEFIPSYFICMTRNPYAFSESLIRKNKISAEDAARFVVKCFKYQQFNIRHLNNIIFFSYESFVNNPEKIKRKLVSFLPELNDIRIRGNFFAHNYSGKKSEIIDYNISGIKRLTKNQIN